jgi:hypothetical protein
VLQKTSAMKKFTLIFLFSLFTIHYSLSQQYDWVDLSINIPDNESILHTTDGGLTWIEEDVSLTDSTFFTSVFALNSHEVYITGQKHLTNDQYQAVLLKYTRITGINKQQKSGIILYQNQPNPYSKSTVISWWWQSAVM